MKMMSLLLLGISAAAMVEYELRSDNGVSRDHVGNAPKAGTFQYKDDSRAQ